MATGTATLDFGVYPSSNEASVAVTGQGAIGTSSQVEAFFMSASGDTTSDHTVDDHTYAPMFISLTCGALVAGTGFTIYGRANDKINGQWIVHWVWV